MIAPDKGNGTGRPANVQARRLPHVSWTLQHTEASNAIKRRVWKEHAARVTLVHTVERVVALAAFVAEAPAAVVSGEEDDVVDRFESG
jgi:hypothetical protein